MCSSCHRAYVWFFQGLHHPIRKRRSNCWRWWRKNVWNYLHYESNVIDNNHVSQVIFDVRKLIRNVYFFICVHDIFIFDRHFQITTYFLIHLTESRVRTDFSSWFSVRVICATSIGPLCDTYYFRFFFFRKRRDITACSRPDDLNLIQKFALQRSVFSFFTLVDFFRDVALIDFFCFVK